MRSIAPDVAEVPSSNASIRPADWEPSHVPSLNISLLGAAPFNTWLKRSKKNTEFEVFAISLRDIEKALEPKKDVDPAQVLPKEYHEFLDVFSKKEADQLPPHRVYDHKITLQPGTTPPHQAMYGMSQAELQVVKQYIKENLSKGFIRASSSPAAAPILFVKKPGGGLRLCVDYRRLNEITKKDRYPLPLIKETLARISKAKIFSKIDIIAAFNRLRMAEGEEWKTAFATRMGLFEYNVLPFGLTGGPASFQRYINDALREYLDEFATAYLDDILIYSESLEEHRDHISLVLQRLREFGLQADIKKCEFHVTAVKYLGLIVTTRGICMDPEKIQAIIEWQAPSCIRDLQAFLGFANFYRRFIKDYSKIAAPLTEATKYAKDKSRAFVWTEDCHQAFMSLKQAFTCRPILMHFDYEKKTVVETDASNHVAAGVMSQYDNKGILHPIAYFSKKFQPAQMNYPIHDKELLAVILAFEHWRAELEGSRYQVDVLSDHKALEYFMSSKKLSQRQARWAEYLSRFDFLLKYRPGSKGEKPDALTRRSGDLPKEGDEILEIQNQTLLKPENLDNKVKQEIQKNIDLHLAQADLLLAPVQTRTQPSTQSKELTHLHLNSDEPMYDEVQSGTLEISDDIEPQDEDVDLNELFIQGYEQDPLPSEVLRALRTGARQSKYLSLAHCAEINNRLYVTGRCYVPDYAPLQLRLLEIHHDRPTAGHPGAGGTYRLLHRGYYWPRMQKYVRQYVKNCVTCRTCKTSRHAKAGYLAPLPVPDHRWVDITVDFVTGLPEVREKDAVCTIVDRLTKERHLVPIDHKIGAEEFAQVFLDNIFRLHGLPRSITSDRGGQFVNEFWSYVCQKLNIVHVLSTAYHPETDGQTERVNAIFEQYLRAYVNYNQDDWLDWLAIAEFTANNLDSATTGMSPFFLNKGYHPLSGYENNVPVPRTNHEIDAATFARRMQELEKVAQEEMALAQADHAYYADRHRSPAPQYKEGDLVYLNIKNLRTKRPCKKLERRQAGPYKITKVVSPTAVRLDLPSSIRAFHTFHVNLVQPAFLDPVPGQALPNPPPVVVDNDNEWEVEAVVDSRLVGKKKLRIQYSVKWVGYPDTTWEPPEVLNHCMECIEVFHRRYPDKPSKALRRSSSL